MHFRRHAVFFLFLEEQVKKLLKIGAFASIIAAALVLGFASCEASTNNAVSVNTGNITGKVTYSNAAKDANGGIIVTLDKTDGLRTAAVRSANTSRSAAEFIKTTTTSDGSYSFEELEPGTYTIYASSNCSVEKAVCTNVVVRSAETTVAEALNLIATGNITGKVTVKDSTENMGFLVFVAGTSYMAVTDMTGTYTISDIPAGNSYMIAVSRNGLLKYLSTNITVEAGETTLVSEVNYSSEELISGLKGADGTNGTDGKDGASINWLGTFSSANEINEPRYLDAYFNDSDGCSYIYTNSGWTLLARAGANGNDGANGTDGTNGADGLSIVWKGERTSSPLDPELNWAYYDKNVGCSYIYNGSKWTLLARAGTNGIDGMNGTNGTDGRDGITIIWKGELVNAPENPELYWAYYCKVTGCSYIWDGQKWNLLAGSKNSDVNYLDIGTDGTAGTNAVYVTLGRWPQTIKQLSSIIITNITKTVGIFTYYKGSDGEWYVKATENAFDSDYRYSTGIKVKQGGTSEQYFKVEPIKWRVLTDNYNGKKLLLAENALINKRFDDDNSRWENSEIRSWLNEDFLSTAFSEDELKLIATMSIENDYQANNPEGNPRFSFDYSDNAFETEDKCFLLSTREATTAVYGFNPNFDEADFTKVRKVTDFSKAYGICASKTDNSCYWFLRSETPGIRNRTRAVRNDGYIESDPSYGIKVTSSNHGIVPAICLN